MRPVLALAWVGVLGFWVVAAREPKPVTYTYHGQVIEDKFAWLNDLSSSKVKRWIKSQNSRTKHYFDRLRALPIYRERLDELNESYPTWIEKVVHVAGKTFAVIDETIVLLPNWHDADDARTLFKAADLTDEHEVAIEAMYPSPDGRWVAFIVGFDGTAEGELCILDVARHKLRKERWTQVHTAHGGDLAWLADSSGFYYTYHPDAKPGGPLGPNRFARRQIRLHKLGSQPTDDKFILQPEIPLFAGISLRTPRKGSELLIGLSTGWASDTGIWYLRDRHGITKQLNQSKDCWLNADFGPGRTITIESWKKASRGRLLTAPLDAPEKIRELVAESGHLISTWLHTPNLLAVVDRKDGSDRLRVFDSQGRNERVIKIPPHSSISELHESNPKTLVFRTGHFLDAIRWYRLNLETGRLAVLGIGRECDCDYDDVEQVREWATSRDGTEVPLTILRKLNCKLNSKNPVLLTGYGGFRDISRSEMSTLIRLWLEHGGVWAIGHLRGDLEGDDAWHRAALMPAKYRTIDDFIACAEHLIARQYTTSDKLAITGASNGGLTVGAAMTRRPELFRAAVIDCGVLDLLRLERDFNGQIDVPEYGTVNNPVHFRYMRLLSPYHRLRDGVKYPATWVRCGINDRRVHPGHSLTFAARLQEIQPKDESAHSMLLSVFPDEGHNLTRDRAETMGFLAAELGMVYSEPSRWNP